MKTPVVVAFVIVLVAFGGIVFLGRNNNNSTEQSDKGIDTFTARKDDVVLDTVATSVSVDRVVSLKGKGLTSVPGAVFEVTDTEELDLSDNNLTGALPGEVRLLSNLLVLDLSNNQFTGVPAEVGQLSKLQLLNLSNNKLTGLPLEIGNLKNLQVLDVSGNEYSNEDLAKIKAMLPNGVLIKTK